ncbi:hypothetical protein TSAR_015233 [Trichomalopsis sarcophagae]|uniref:NADH dehydrogenase [ubiquinone] 1 subunit C2 n=1 Tax=Trichomalopsis sarcophagae TaxID=543379 RepID=A0A232ERD2_9HYME|nr:hypothetical protein TSAR_015233 [Trichomalopsis sarcophagae]
MTTENPDIQWALDLLTPDPNYQENFISKNYPWIVCPFITVGGNAYVTYLQGRPWYSGIRRYALAIGAGIIMAKVLKDAKYHREAERDAVMRHYIKLHPEDFPPPVRKTFNEELRDWVACR